MQNPANNQRARRLRGLLIPAGAIVLAAAILVGSYLFAKGGTRTYQPAPPLSPVAMLGAPTPNALAAVQTPAASVRGSDGRYVSQDTPLQIPDNNRKGALSRIPVPDHLVITNVQVVDLAVTHPDTGELRVRLLGPDMTVVELMSGLCPGAHNWAGLILNDAAPELLGAVCTNNLVGARRPPPGHALAAFQGLEAQGDWVLSVTDTRPGNVGTLDGWGLLFTPLLSPTPTPTVTSTATRTVKPGPTARPTSTPVRK